MDWKKKKKKNTEKLIRERFLFFKNGNSEGRLGAKSDLMCRVSIELAEPIMMGFPAKSWANKPYWMRFIQPVLKKEGKSVNRDLESILKRNKELFFGCDLVCHPKNRELLFSSAILVLII